MKKRNALHTALLLSLSAALAQGALPVLAQETGQTGEYQENAFDSAAESAGFFAPVPATEEEFEAVANSGLKADIHARDLKGNWTRKTITLDQSRIDTITIRNEERTIAAGYINFSCYPEGYISYTGPFDGSKNAKPAYSALFDGKTVGGATIFEISKGADGKWSSPNGGEDYWCTEMLPYEQLKTVSIRFHSDATGKNYEIPLKDNTYAGVSLNEAHFNEEPTFLIVNLQLEAYRKELSRLTGKTVSFGGSSAQSVSPAGQPQNQRQISFGLDASGMWNAANRTFDINGMLKEGNNGISFAESEAVQTGKSAMYRLYNPNSGEHFYTANAAEKDSLVNVGWKYEGEGWEAPATSKTPVYRLYNPNAGDHHYTLDLNEKNHLVSVGWKYEGIGWYSDDAKAVPLYRQYNPNAKAGSHNYTTSKEENDGLVRLGWNAEGIGWYGVK